MYLFQRSIQDFVLSPSPRRTMTDQYALPRPCLSHFYRPSLSPSTILKTNMVAESLKLFVRRTRHVGRAKMDNILQALRTNDKENSSKEQNKCLSRTRADSFSKSQKYDSVIAEDFRNPSSRSSTPSSSSPSTSPDLDTEVIHSMDSNTELSSDTVTKHNPNSRLSTKMYKAQLDDETMIELQKMDPSGVLRGMSARQIRRLIQQKRSEAWLTETDGPLYESTEEYFSEDMMTQSSGESCTRYYPALEPTEDEDWSQYF
ncbi:hypothetical protein DFH28DRAFT_1180997 [Melampsora americana]|nr:hypothetical protein DFH28DRAFT_1180997 [Melampsora americana]